MASQGPNSAGTAANDLTVGSLSWSNLTNIVSSNNSYCDRSFTLSGQKTAYLKTTNYGFSVTAGATIDGIVAEFESSYTGANAPKFSTVKSYKGGTVGGNEQVAGNIPVTTTDAYYSFGSSVDLWGQTWTTTDINASNFGAGASFSSTGSASIRVDHARITVYYTLPLSPPFKSGSLSIPMSICAR